MTRTQPIEDAFTVLGNYIDCFEELTASKAKQLWSWNIQQKKEIFMNQHLHLITLGVRDIERSRKFYSEILGWKPASVSSDDVAFFQAGGVVLGLYPREKLAEDVLTSPEGIGFAGITLAYNARSEAEVDEIVRDLEAKGVGIAKQPQKVFWGGYSSYFVDPDGFHWEVAYNPFFPLDEGGNLKLE